MNENEVTGNMKRFSDGQVGESGGNGFEDGNGAVKVFIKTFGCQMNVLDSQLVHGQLRGMGYRFVDDWKQADVVLFNTCSVRENAEQKVYSILGRVGKYKKEFPQVVVGVLGCMAEREGVDIARKYPQVDLLCGPGELDKVPLLIDNAMKTEVKARQSLRSVQKALQGNTNRRSSTLDAAGDNLEMLDLSRSFSPDEYEGAAYVRITRGCNKFCSYCVVPNTRGQEIHRSPDAIFEECQKLVEAGVVEITLLGQTVNHYHYDGEVIDGDGPQVGAAVGRKGIKGSSDGTVTFAQLLAKIHDGLPDLKRLRFVTSFPRDFGDDILKVMAERPRICRYLHLPVQSGSDRMLKDMNRGYTVAEYKDLLARVRKYLPGVTIASDLICGFPGETEADHLQTCELLKEAKFKNCFVFKYSPRPGTIAIDKFPDDVSEADKRRRNNELLAIQADNSKAIHDSFVGKTVEVFVESVSHKAKKQANAADASVELGWAKDEQVTQLTGRTDGDLIVMFDADPTLVGQLVEVEIERALSLTLFGKITE